MGFARGEAFEGSTQLTSSRAELGNDGASRSLSCAPNESEGPFDFRERRETVCFINKDVYAMRFKVER